MQKYLKSQTRNYEKLRNKKHPRQEKIFRISDFQGSERSARCSYQTAGAPADDRHEGIHTQGGAQPPIPSVTQLTVTSHSKSLRRHIVHRNVIEITVTSLTSQYMPQWHKYHSDVIEVTRWSQSGHSDSLRSLWRCHAAEVFGTQEMLPVNGKTHSVRIKCIAWRILSLCSRQWSSDFRMSGNSQEY